MPSLLAALSGGSVLATATAVPLPAAPPTNVVRPTISGDARDGETLTGAPGSWTGGTQSISYQWQACAAGGSDCIDIASADASTYHVAASDVGHTIGLVVLAADAGGEAAAAAAPTPLVAAAEPAGSGWLGPAGSRVCTVTVASAAAVLAAVGAAASGAVVCVAGGAYAGLTLSGIHAQDVTVQPVPGSSVTLTAGVHERREARWRCTSSRGRATSWCSDSM